MQTVFDRLLLCDISFLIQPHFPTVFFRFIFRFLAFFLAFSHCSYCPCIAYRNLKIILHINHTDFKMNLRPDSSPDARTTPRENVNQYINFLLLSNSSTHSKVRGSVPQYVCVYVNALNAKLASGRALIKAETHRSI